MKLKEYAKYIHAINKKYPELDVIYSTDDEGNNFSEVLFAPSVGNLDKNSEMFTPSKETNFNKELNVICIN